MVHLEVGHAEENGRKQAFHVRQERKRAIRWASGSGLLGPYNGPILLIGPEMGLKLGWNFKEMG